MRYPSFPWLRVAVVVLAIAALWWFVDQDWPEEAVAEGFFACGFATLAESILVRWLM